MDCRSWAWPRFRARRAASWLWCPAAWASPCTRLSWTRQETACGASGPSSICGRRCRSTPAPTEPAPARHPASISFSCGWVFPLRILLRQIRRGSCMSGEHRVSTMSPTLGQRQRAAAFALLMACGCALAVPLADTRVPLFSGLGIINDTAFALLGLIVAALLYLQFRATRAPAVLVLASGFLLLSLTTLPQLLRESQGAFIDLRLLFIADFSLPAAAIGY